MVMISLKNLTKRFGKTVAVKECNLAIEKGEFVVFLGPSGCGKTTTLRCIAGLETPTNGEIYIDEEMVNDLPTLDRDVGFVFQHYALFPHMTAYANISFPLRAMNYRKQDIENEVEKVADLLKLHSILYLKPSQLSSGDMQRVALARALVIKPKVFLLDEPLSTLDAEFREEARTMIKRIHLEIGATTIYVTHDQLEAMAIADRIVTMKSGMIQQVGKPEDVYHKPTNMFVANFLGSPGMNFIPCAMDSGKKTLKLDIDGRSIRLTDEVLSKTGGFSGRDMTLGVRPEDIRLTDKQDEFGFPMEVTVVEELGPENIINLKSGERVVKALMSPDFLPKPGERFWVVPDQSRIRLFDTESNDAIN
jgi:multiple sugar transport system ATP-binding protein